MKPDDVRKNVLGTEIAYIPQAAMNALNPTRKIRKFIEDVVLAHEPKRDKKEIYEMAKARFDELGLPVEALDKHCLLYTSQDSRLIQKRISGSRIVWMRELFFSPVFGFCASSFVNCEGNLSPD